MKEFFKNLDWKGFFYNLLTGTVIPVLEKLVASSENKWDDACVNAVKLLVETLLKPEEVAE